jgi:putative FmdB family regulatory protein
MPLYEYRCSACHERFEVLQRMGESSEKVRCPECGAKQVEKQLSTFAAGHGGGGAAASFGGGCGAPACGTGFT